MQIRQLSLGLKRVISFMLIISLMPLLAFAETANAEPAENPEYQKGYENGKEAAKGNGLWFLSGFLLPGVGLILPWLFSPKSPTDDLAGKSSEYVEGYSDGYKKKAKVKNFGWALGGTGAAAGVSIIVGLIAIRQGCSSCGDSIGSSCGNSLGSSCSSIPVISNFQRAYNSD